jgi:hypothetical protein
MFLNGGMNLGLKTKHIRNRSSALSDLSNFSCLPGRAGGSLNGLELLKLRVHILRGVEGLDTAEISECLEVSEETDKVRLHRARDAEIALPERGNVSTGIVQFSEAPVRSRSRGRIEAHLPKIDRSSGTGRRCPGTIAFIRLFRQRPDEPGFPLWP